MSFQNTPWKTGQVTITGSAVQIIAAEPARSGIQITNLGSTDIYLIENNSGTTSTGHLLIGTRGASVSFSTTGAIYAITGGGSQAVSYLATY